MKKKLFATLGALCLGVILCVSSVFAANWWYSINNDDAGTTTVTFGKSIALSVTGTDEGAATGAYQNSVITFNNFTVAAPKWDEQTATDGMTHTNGTLPTFDLVITSSIDLTNVATASVKINGADPAVGVSVTQAGATVTIADIQKVADGANFTVTLTLTMKDTLDVALQNTSFTVTAAITTTAEGDHL